MDLRHPNIVQLQDFGRESVQIGDENRDVTYIVQEFVDGQSLKQILNEGRHLGIAGLTDERQLDATELTKQGTFIGTPAYMSPEQFKHEPAGPASDLYSLAITLFELLAWKRPFKARIFVEWAMAHVSEPVPTLPPSIPGPVSAVVATAMSKSPTDRFPDAATMRAALASAAETFAQRFGHAVPLPAEVRPVEAADAFETSSIPLEAIPVVKTYPDRMVDTYSDRNLC